VLGVEQEAPTVVSIPELQLLSAKTTDNVAARARKLKALNCIVGVGLDCGQT
jgi:hypothetical protein